MKVKRSSVSNSDARFIGWQEMYSGDLSALYTITAAGHPACGSTVTEKTLNKLNLQVPDQHSSKDQGDSTQILAKEKRTDLNELKPAICTKSGGRKKRIHWPSG